MEVLNSHDLVTIKAQKEKLLKENTEMRKLVGLLQENVELRCILADHGSLDKDCSIYQANKDSKMIKDSIQSIQCKESEQVWKGESAVHAPQAKESEAVWKGESTHAPEVKESAAGWKGGSIQSLQPQATDSLYPVTPVKGSFMDTRESQQDYFSGSKNKEAEGETASLNLYQCRLQDSQELHSMERTVGEIAFQLDRRILAFIFQDRARLYGISVSNISEKINEFSCDRHKNKVDEVKRAEMTKRYTDIMNKLQEFGYDPKNHPQFTEYLVNRYGILKERPQPGSSEFKNLLDPEILKRTVTSIVPCDDVKTVQILLRCLKHLAKEDGKPLFVW
ncbi:speriolin-like protein isoform X2 [Rhinatrema bivittatum]|uniref:speriolin-like protein isoform X2 n=1 Tax=Rhinatrema bivittatum TaxID=194408 RepID=UPI00112813CB|nr:speriolin-like protein isoform X2 [Rhinatrema bivittatum]